MYFNSKEITADFFSKDNLAKRDHRITVEEHPFLYNLLKSKILHKSSFRDDADDPTSDEDDNDSLQDSDEELVEKDWIGFIVNLTHELVALLIRFD
jgi:hypothetical protein